MPRTVKTDPNLTVGAPTKPASLSTQASKEWDRLIGELQRSRIAISEAHRATLSLAATIAADIKDAWACVERDGAYIEGKAGLVAHPASKRLDALRRDYFKVLVMLGLRAMVAQPEQVKEETLDDILNG